MSTQSILEMNKDSLHNEYEENLLYCADAFYVQDKFMVGKGVSLDEISHIMNFHRLMCTDNCEMVEYINNKIIGELGCEKKPLCDTIQEYKSCHNKEDCSDTEVIEQCCLISDIGTTEW